MIYLAIPFLLWFSLKNIQFKTLLLWVTHLSTFTIVVLILFNVAAFGIMGIRWFYLLYLEGVRIPFVRLTILRLIGFAWSYITPGTQFGGEILQVRYSLTADLSLGISSVTLLQDRVLEIAGNLLIIVTVFSFYYFHLIGVLLSTIPFFGIVVYFIFFSGFQGFNIEQAAVRFVLLFVQNKNKRYSFFKGIKKLKIPRVSWPDSYISRTILLLSIFVTPVIAVLEILLFFNITGYSINILDALVILIIIKLTNYIPVPGAVGFFEAGILFGSTILDLPLLYGMGFILYRRSRDIIQVGLGLLLSIKEELKDRGRTEDVNKCG